MPPGRKRSIRVRLIGLLGLLSAIGVLLQPTPASSASWLPPRTVYVDAVQRLIWTHGFDMTERVFFPRRGTYSTSIAYRAPQRLRTINLQSVPGFEIRVQVRRTFCQWSTGPTAHRIFCGSAPWDDGVVAQKVTTELLAALLPRATFTRSTMAADSRAGVVRIAIAAPEAPRLCPPRSICSVPGYNPHGRYSAVLLVTARGGLPVSFESRITESGHTSTFQRVTFSYHHLRPITLPAGRHIHCPRAAPGQWCLKR
jgi:hypothetical protein